jgi:hypothetical protein
MENLINLYLGYEAGNVEDEMAKEMKDAKIKEDKNNGKPKIEIKHPGAFTEWCKKQGFDGVTCGCVCKGLESDDPVIRKRANFATNFGGFAKKCKCVKEIRERRKKGKK